MHALHSVQRSLFTVMAPNGAPAASAIALCGVGAWRARWSMAKSSVVRFSGDRLKLAGFATVCAGASATAAASPRTMPTCAPP